MSESTIVAIVVGVGVPIATFVFTYLTNRQSADREAARDERKMGHERRLAHESRIHGWRSEAYRDLLRVLQRTRVVIEMTMPVLDEGQKPPDPPTDAEQDAMEAAVAAYGSADVRERLEAVRRTRNEFFYGVHDYRRAQAQGERPGAKDQIELYRQVEDKRRQYRAEHEAIRAAVAAELQELRADS